MSRTLSYRNLVHGDIEHLFGVRPSAAQTLIKSIGGIHTVGATHFLGRASLLAFLDEMIAAESVEVAMQASLLETDATPKSKSLRATLPSDLRNVMVRALPNNLWLSPGKLEIDAPNTEALLESL